MSIRVGAYGVAWPPFDAAVASAAAAEQAGFDWALYADQTDFTHPQSAWTPDLSSMATIAPRIDAWFDGPPLIAASAPSTSEIGFAWGVTDVVRRSPVVLAQTLLSLDHATAGRAMMIVGSGENKQMKPYGVSRKGATNKLHDAVPMIKALMSTNDPVNFEGRVWKMREAVLGLEPYGEKTPEVWVAGGGPDILRLVGEHADGWFIYVPGCSRDNPTQFEEEVAAVRRHADEAGRDPDEISIAVLLIAAVDVVEANLDAYRAHPFLKWNTLVATPSADVWREWGIEHPYGWDWAYGTHMFPQWIGREEFDEKVALVPDEAIDRVNFIGTPEQVHERARPYIDAGATDVFVYNFGALCGLEYVESSGRGVVELAALLKGRPIDSGEHSYATVV